MGLRKLLCAFAVLFLLAPVLAWSIDSDGDGLSDTVEAQLGSSPLHKDIFIEIDWFVVNGQNLKPRKGFDKIVEAIFDSSPVNNPDGKTGIRVHLSYSDAIPVNFDVLGYKNSKGNYVWDDFDIVKSIYFTPSRYATHHYCLFIKDYGDQSGQATGSSGLSRNGKKFSTGASDLIVALGGDYWWNYPKKKEYKWTQAGTFAHELGHNLGLKHGGADHRNYKPNLLSIMNYAFQSDGIPYTRYDGKRFFIYDFSRQALPTLTEANLNENKGLGPKASDAYGVFGTAWYHWNGTDYIGQGTWNATSFVDWNQDGFASSSVFGDINQDGSYSKLKGNNQWSKLTFSGGSVGGGVAPSALPRETSMDCLTAHEHALHKRNDDPNIPRITMKDLIEEFQKGSEKQ
jgi:Bacterial TSP3 repeat